MNPASASMLDYRDCIDNLHSMGKSVALRIDGRGLQTPLDDATVAFFSIGGRRGEPQQLTLSIL